MLLLNFAVGFRRTLVCFAFTWQGGEGNKKPGREEIHGPGLSQVMQTESYRMWRIKSSTLIDKHASLVSPSWSGQTWLGQTWLGQNSQKPQRAQSSHRSNKEHHHVLRDIRDHA